MPLLATIKLIKKLKGKKKKPIYEKVKKPIIKKTFLEQNKNLIIIGSLSAGLIIYFVTKKK